MVDTISSVNSFQNLQSKWVKYQISKINIDSQIIDDITQQNISNEYMTIIFNLFG